MLRVLKALTILILLSNPVFAIEDPQPSLNQSGIIAKLGTQIHGDISFKDSDLGELTISSVLSDKKPLIIIPVYYECPRLCGLVMAGVERLIASLPLMLGQDYNILTLSFDETETVELAKSNKQEMIKKLGDVAQPWHFAVSDRENIKLLLSDLGFNFMRDEGEFVHSAGIFVISNQGQLSQYFTGIDFRPQDMRLALVDASNGRIGSAIDHILLFCFRFDPTKGKYTWAVFNLLKVVGVLSIAALGGLIFFLKR